MASTYEEIMAKSRELFNAGDVEGAKRLAKIAVDRKAAATPKAQQNADGTFGQVPEGFFLNPKTGQMTSRELLVSNVPEKGRLNSFAGGASQGITLGGMDEIVGGAKALWAGLTGKDMGDAYKFGRELTLAATDAARRDHPGYALAGEIGGAVSLPIGGGAPISTRMKMLESGLRAVPAAATYGLLSSDGEGTGRLKDARNMALLGGILGMAAPGVGGLLGAAVRNSKKAKKAFVKNAPSVEDLKTQAGALYDKARATGVQAQPPQLQQLQADMTKILTDEGLISPTGRMSTAYPKVSDALKMVEDYSAGTMDATQMQQVRKLLQKAAQSNDAQEARVGTQMLKQFDDFVEPLAPEFKQANAIYRTAKQGELIERTIAQAESKSGQFSGSGFENALRTEFRALDRQIIKGQLKVSPDEAALIRKIARGGKMENLLRDLGKAAPRGIVGTGISTGVPFAIGNAVGGPAIGGLLSAATLGVGEVGRRMATKMQSGNAGMLSAIARSGGQAPALPPPQSFPLIETLMRRAAAAAPQNR